MHLGFKGLLTRDQRNYIYAKPGCMKLKCQHDLLLLCYTQSTGSAKCDLMGAIEVVVKFCITSLFMWALPLFLLYAFKHDLVPGLSPQSHTLWSGGLAVFSVNVVIVVYVLLALRESPSTDSRQCDLAVSVTPAVIDSSKGEEKID
ncbi:hypothetical protein O6H91_03G079300 [Diphasiastrum complanatum]|uniref:Uncharacterized protein n=1 Tax=Diphasiastrum complanatum TaxID=34168 RepID=A0ACC2E7Q4_DIPCM|nr:hypothetical protein O6H91_03G079300 [Diphasiastrum complanatum]